ncbi:MAG: hypothetical protein WDN31_19105 [Hyphomicrobium sp.]
MAARCAPRQVAALDFVTGNHQNVLGPGELLRSIRLPARALAKRFAFRRARSRTGGARHHRHRHAEPRDARSGAHHHGSDSAPYQLRFDRVPDAKGLRDAILVAIPEADYFDVHGSARYKRHLTYYFAEQIRAELLERDAP